MSLYIDGAKIDDLRIDGVSLDKAYLDGTEVFTAFNPLTDDPVPIGTYYDGGYYAGKMQQDDGIYALIVAPKDPGEIPAIYYKTANTASTGAQSTYDGWANTNAQNNSTHPGFERVRDLVINGRRDWYIPSIFELQLMYANLKPNTTSNSTYSDRVGDGCTNLVNGTNPYSVPETPANTSSVPSRVSSTLFQSGGSQSLNNGGYWSSTECCVRADSSWYVIFTDGGISHLYKDRLFSVRAVRRAKL